MDVQKKNFPIEIQLTNTTYLDYHPNVIITILGIEYENGSSDQQLFENVSNAAGTTVDQV